MLEFKKMSQYHWKFVLVRDFLSLLGVLVWSLQSYAGTVFQPRICNPTWTGFLSFVALVIGAIAVIEFLSWAIWFLRKASQETHMQRVAGDATSLVLINSRDFRPSLIKLVIGLILVLLSTLVGGPSPCEPLHVGPWSWMFVLGCVICGLGFLTIASGIVREE